MMRWHRSGQSCINPNIAIPLSSSFPGYGSAARRLAFQDGGAKPSRFSAEARQPKARNVVVSRILQCQVGENLAQHRGEFKAMAGTGRSDDDLRISRQSVYDKIAVRGVGVKAGFGREQFSVGRGNVSRDCAADHGLIGRRYLAREILGIDDLVAVMMFRELHSIFCMQRQAVMDAPTSL